MANDSHSMNREAASRRFASVRFRVSPAALAAAILLFAHIALFRDGFAQPADIEVEEAEPDATGERPRLESGEGDPDYSGEIIVTGDRRARARSEATTRTEVISREAIVKSGAVNAADALEHQPGVEIRRGIRGRSLRLQGLDPQYVLILVDGERVAGRIDNAIDLTRIKAGEIERIEIIKGASSALYGSDAIGGVVNIITRSAKGGALGPPVEAEAELAHGNGRESQFGSEGETRASGYVGLNNDFISTAFTTGWTRSGGYDLTPFTGRDRIATTLTDIVPTAERDRLIRKQGTTGPEFTDVNVGNRSVFRLTEDLHVRAGGQFRALDQSLVDTAAPRQLLDRRNQTEDGMINVSPILYLSNDGSVKAGYSYSRFYDRLEVDQRQSDSLDREETQDERVQEGKLQLDYEFFDDHFVTLGSDFVFDELISERIDARYAFRQRLAFFAQDEWTVLDGPREWRVSPGVRFEDDSLFGSQTTPKFATRFDAASNLVLRASAGAGFRAPSFKDLFFDFQNPGVGYQVIGNPDLDPERSKSYNAGVEYDPFEWLALTLNLYYNSIDNLIDFTAVPNRGGELATFQTQNIRKAFTRGVEFQADFRITDAWSFGVGYTLTDSRDVDQGIPLEGRAKHRGLYYLNYEYQPWRLGLSIRGSVYGPQAYRSPKVAYAALNSNG
ncbi:MAG: TonB-dependent receptor, partial [Leptospirales bacterium]